MNQALVLASKSPRRHALLSQLGYQFTCMDADIDESVLINESGADYVLRLATEKAQYIAQKNSSNSVILGADTCVLINDEILSKPLDFQDSRRMLKQLSGGVHHVYTAVAVIGQHQLKSCLVKTKVFFKALSENEIKHYWQTGEPQDKAGSYAIQGIAGQFVTKIEGSYSAVVGLPLYETVELLSSFGIRNLINDTDSPINEKQKR
jgi:septum formation protein